MIRLNGKHIYGHSEYSVPIRISLCLSTKVIRVETQVVGVGNGLCVVYRRFATGYFDGSHGYSYTLIAACDINGFILEACETIQQKHNSSDKDPTRGTVDGECFRDWLVTKLIPNMGNQDPLLC